MKKFLVVLLAVCMLFAFAACSNNEQPAGDDANGENAQTGDTVLTMATEGTFPPYEYYEGGELVGIDVEIAGAIAEKLGMTLEIMDMEFNSIISAVSSGKADIGMAGMTVEPDRLESVNFSDTYATGVQVVIVPEGSPITSVDDLSAEGATYIIGVQESTTGDIFATEDFGNDRVSRFNKNNDLIMALTTGRVDCVILDNEPAKSFVAANEGLTILDTEYAVEDYAIAIAKENTELLDQINAALAELTADGTIPDIIEKYIPSDGGDDANTDADANTDTDANTDANADSDADADQNAPVE